MKSSIALAMVAVYTNAVTINSQKAPPQTNTGDQSLLDEIRNKHGDVYGNIEINYYQLSQLFNNYKCKPSKDSFAQTAAETENYGYAHYGGGSQHYGYAQTEQYSSVKQQQCGDVGERIDTIFPKGGLDQYIDQCVSKLKSSGLAQTENAPPFFNESTWNEKMLPAGGLAQTESNAAAETENHYGYGYGYGHSHGYAQTESNAAAHPAQNGIHMLHAQTESKAAAETEQYGHHGYYGHGYYAQTEAPQEGLAQTEQYGHYGYGGGYGGYAQTEAPAQ